VSGRVLVVDDDQGMCELIATGLGKRGFEVTWRTSADEAFALLQTDEFDVVISDLNMRGMSGIDLCERIVANRPDIPVVVVTAFGSLETAVAAIRAGAYDFITKPFQNEVLRLTLERAIQHRALRAEVTRLRRAVAEAQGFEGMIGNSEPMRRVYDLLDRVAETDATVLITGESGTGKELVARALAARSRRQGGPFVAINCAAVPEALLESELFGHGKGAFTDAKAARTGLFVQASGGVLFLDEIGELPLGLQPKLLRALQERKVRPLGGEAEVGFDVRLVAATNRDLETAVEERRFREDLFYRINVITVALPPLRARGTDVLLLAQHYVQHFAAQFAKSVTGISPGAAERLASYGWPGNVRELQNCIERAVALTRFAEIVVEDLPEKIRNYRRTHVVVATDDPSELVPLEEIERRYILRALEALGGNRTLTAQVLGLDRKTLYRKLRAYGAVDKDTSTSS
jgi:two-component system response regulator HydG